MVDSEKGKSSTGEAKTKTSLLDEDFSKDFLGSWKSMSATGDDDMDFNFEPVSKGKKKAFNFGMDMDFSLDDTFGKMPSFKMDMADLDFSSSPKKSTKSKDKSEDQDSAKGNRADKHDKFTFAFDFDGLDDFSLDAPSTKGGKSPIIEIKSKKEGSELEDFPEQVTNDKGETVEDTISKGPQVCEDVSKPENLVVGNGYPDAQSGNSVTESIDLTHPVQPKAPLISFNKKLAEDTVMEDHQSNQEGESSWKKVSSPVTENNLDVIPVNKSAQSIGSLLPVETAELHMSLEFDSTVTSMNIDDNIQLKEETISKQACIQFKEADVSVNIPLVEASTQVNVSEETEVSSSDRDIHEGSSESGTLVELPAAINLTSDNEKQIVDKSLLQCSMEKMHIGVEKNELGDSGSLGGAKIPLDIGNPSAASDANALSSSARSTAGIQKPALKNSTASYDSGPNSAKAMLLSNKVPGVVHSKFPVLQAKNGCRTEFSAIKDNGEASTHIGSIDKSYDSGKHDGKELGDSPSLCGKELIKQDSVLEKSETTSSAHTTLRDHEHSINGKNRNEVSVDTVPHNGKAAFDGLPSVECVKMLNNVKSSGFKSSSSTPPDQRTRGCNQGQGKLKDKLTSITIQKSNNSLANKLSSQRIDKKMPALPSLKFTRSTITDTSPAVARVQGNAKSQVSFENSARLQASIKMVSPTSSEKPILSTSSLKRKPSEAADADPANLHMPKRASPSENRIPKVLSRELDDGAQTQCNFSEGSGKKVSTECMTPKLNFDQEAKMEALEFCLMVENDTNVEKAEACAKELDNICNMLKKQHEEAKELLVRALVNNNNLLMLNHPIYEEKIRAVLKFASRLTSKELEVGAA